MKHLYLAVECKTSACAQMQTLRYVGAAEQGLDARIRESLDAFPLSLEVACHACGKSAVYTLRDLRPAESESGPPEGFENGF